MLRPLILFTIIVFTASCAPKTRNISDNQSEIKASQTLDTSNNQPVEEPEKWYGRNNPFILSKDEQAILNNLTNTHGNFCTLEGSIINAARKHAKDISMDKVLKEDGLDMLRSNMLFYGNYDYRIQPYVFNLSENGINSLKKLLFEEKDNFTHCGIGVYNSPIPVAIFIGVKRSIDIKPFKSSVVPGSSIQIHGKFADTAHFDAEAYLENPDGSVKKIKTYVLGKNSFSFSVQFKGTGKYRLELQVTGKNGSETSLLVPIFSGIDIDLTPSFFPDNNDDDSPLDAQLVNLINSVRQKHGLKILQRDKTLDMVARNHSKDMMQNGFFGHYSQTTGFLEDRLQKLQIFPAYMGENIAKSRTVLRTHHNLMNSPSHKIKILDPQFTHFGAGIIKTNDGVIVTEIFTK
ncbi:MAG: hypothetical protein JXR91_04180 [Deltaproteobacteria bacterium]|nr:hypothetical protein [Deltaproteobacteria bacterium]